MLRDLVLINHYYVDAMEKAAKAGRLKKVKATKRRGAKLSGGRATKRIREEGEGQFIISLGI